MQLTKEKRGECSILSVHGRLDGTTSPKFETEVLGWLSGGGKAFVLDMAGISFMSSAALRVLLTMAKRVGRSGGKVVLASPNAVVSEVFEISNFSAMFTICQTLEEGVTAATSGLAASAPAAAEPAAKVPVPIPPVPAPKPAPAAPPTPAPKAAPATPSPAAAPAPAPAPAAASPAPVPVPPAPPKSAPVTPPPVAPQAPAREPAVTPPPPAAATSTPPPAIPRIPPVHAAPPVPAPVAPSLAAEETLVVPPPQPTPLPAASATVAPIEPPKPSSAPVVQTPAVPPTPTAPPAIPKAEEKPAPVERPPQKPPAVPATPPPARPSPAAVTPPAAPPIPAILASTPIPPPPRIAPPVTASRNAGPMKLEVIVGSHIIECRDGDVIGIEGTVAPHLFKDATSLQPRHVLIGKGPEAWFVMVPRNVQIETHLDDVLLTPGVRQNLSGEHRLRVAEFAISLRLAEGQPPSINDSFFNRLMKILRLG